MEFCVAIENDKYNAEIKVSVWEMYEKAWKISWVCIMIAVIEKLCLCDQRWREHMK